MELIDVAVVVLASGLSRRFVGGHKLLTPYKSKLVAAHISDVLKLLPVHW